MPRCSRASSPTTRKTAARRSRFATGWWSTGQPAPDKRSWLYGLSFPSQQHKLAPGAQPVDPTTKKPAGTIVDLDDVAGTLVLRRGPNLQGVALPQALVPQGPVQTREQRGALGRLAFSILADDGRY